SQQPEAEVAAQTAAEILQGQAIGGLEIHAPRLELTQIHRRVVDSRDGAVVARRSEGDAIAERLHARMAEIDDVLHTEAERRTGDRIVDDDAIPVGGELEPLERTGPRREYEADRRRIGPFGLE